MEMPTDFYLILATAFAVGFLLGLLLMWLIARAGRGRLQAEVERLPQLEEQLAALQEDKVKLHEKIAALETSRQALAQAQETMRDAFQSLASQALKDNAEQFLGRARDSLDGFLKQVSGGWETHKAELQTRLQPLDQALKDMDKNLKEIEAKREGAYGALGENLSQLQKLNQQLQAETGKLSHALRAGVQQRGRWAEIQLQRLVELAGMQEHVDFDTQFTVGNVRPDMVVRLPQEGSIVVDAKAPLTHYLEALDSPSEETRVKKLEEHARRVKQHVMHLSSKDYTRHLPEGPFVVMYIPSEACLSAALDSDHLLQEYAFEKNIILATPNIIFALLKTVATCWQQYLIDKYAKEILAHGQELYHRLQKFSEHLAGIGKGLKTAVGKYNEAVGSYKERLLPEAQRFQELRGASGEALPEVQAVDTQPRQLQPPEAPDEPTSD
jgi:DNA recombination protein RmuC